MKNLILTLIGIAFVTFSIYIVLHQPAPAKYQKGNTIEIGGTVVPVEIRDTPEERAQGLSGRESLAEGTGMLFVFETPAKYGFWMKDMNFPIDMIWIGEDMRVVTVHRSVPPDSFPEVYSPDENVKYVLEVPAGFSDMHSIDTQDYLSLGGLN